MNEKEDISEDILCSIGMGNSLQITISKSSVILFYPLLLWE